MPEPSTPVSPPDQVPTAVSQKRRKKLLPVIILATLLVVSGGAGAFYFQRAGAAGKSQAERKKAQAARVAEEEEDAETTAREETGGDSRKVELSDDSAVEQVVELPPFIVNLADKDAARYLRLTVSLGINDSGDEGGEKPGPLFTTRVRNAMLGVLTTKTSEEVLSTEGKAALAKELRRAARAASTEPRVEAIYITDFIVQL